MSADTVQFTVQGNPIPKARPRVVLRQGKKVHAFTPARSAAWEEAVAWEARRAMGGREPWQGPVRLRVRFWRKDRRRVDLDNLCKSVKDPLNGIVWEDDSQVTELGAWKGVDRDRPRAEVEAKLMEEEAG